MITSTVNIGPANRHPAFSDDTYFDDGTSFDDGIDVSLPKVDEYLAGVVSYYSGPFKD